MNSSTRAVEWGLRASSREKERAGTGRTGEIGSSGFEDLRGYLVSPEIKVISVKINLNSKKIGYENCIQGRKEDPV